MTCSVVLLDPLTGSFYFFSPCIIKYHVFLHVNKLLNVNISVLDISSGFSAEVDEISAALYMLRWIMLLLSSGFGMNQFFLIRIPVVRKATRARSGTSTQYF
ncbi:hypothetical protein BDV30DRAFT_139540 [Aspergillus minisclerotigenes]|uniref:Uncharacterized protein n=1 Tax=Aspergillus minisclerotigenes TaxID=656917 RepID=A0A5N6J0I5_9EURO|nr:hypothetical protein BDV30DRAFT_139540 [Aspergillus minisclerotigenes]